MLVFGSGDRVCHRRSCVEGRRCVRTRREDSDMGGVQLATEDRNVVQDPSLKAAFATPTS